MKKLHVLIPSLAIAGTLPALCAVSCGSKDTSNWNLEDGEFKWKHGLASGSVNSEEEATNKYFNEIDNKLLADDLMKKQSDFILEQAAKYLEVSFSIKVINIDKQEHRLTFNVEGSQVKKSRAVATSTTKMEYVNFPMELIWNADPLVPRNKGWCVSSLSDDELVNEAIMPEVYRRDHKWSFSCDVNIDGQSFIKGTINYLTEETVDTISIMKACFQNCFPSYYFKDVELSNK